MAHVVTDKCQRCKFTDCVEVCPVACFYELDGQLVIHADDCIDCTACVEVCPVEAIYAEASVPAEFQASIQFNADEAKRVKDSGQEAIAAAHRATKENRVGLLNHARYGMVSGPWGSTATRACGPNRCKRSFTAAPMSRQGVKWQARTTSSGSEL